MRRFQVAPEHDEGKSNIKEVLVVCLSIPAIVFFFSLLRKPISVSMEETILAVASLAAILSPGVFPPAACFTALVIAAILINVPHAHSDKVDPSFKQKPSFITHFRGILMLLTCAAIFAVDFNPFPNRFHKTSFFGTTLMDVGVGMIVFGSGIVEGGRKRKQQKLFTRSEFVNQALVLVVGLLRVLLLWALNYRQDVNEYGVHWNFFFTLWGVMWTSATIRWLVPEKFRMLVALAGLTLYEIALQLQGLEEYMFYHTRNNFISSNREGIFGCIGFTALYFLGNDVGKRAIWEPLSRGTGTGEIVLRLFVLGSIMLFEPITFRNHISRRLTNASYVLWIGGHSSICLCFICVIDALSCTTQIYTSPCLSFISSHQMIVFLIANIIVGIINLATNTHKLGDTTSIVILTIYMLMVVKSARVIDSCMVYISRYRSKNKQNKEQQGPLLSP